MEFSKLFTFDLPFFTIYASGFVSASEALSLQMRFPIAINPHRIAKCKNQFQTNEFIINKAGKFMK